MNEKKALFIINILKNIIDVYFDTFFVFYFFKAANYNIVPLAKYYLTLYLFIGIGFSLIRQAMKRNAKVPYFRIGISMQAVYIAFIMLLKNKIINYVFLVGIIKGIADGFYHFPKNIINTEKVLNADRQKFDGIINIINKIVAIIIPLILGVLLTFISYVNLGKIFFVLFIVMFILSFYFKDDQYSKDNLAMQKFIKLIKIDRNIKYALCEPLLSGLTFSSGVMATIITLFKIYNFKTNLNLGFVDSICALLALVTGILFATKIKKSSFNKVTLVSGIMAYISLFAFAIWPSRTSLIFFLLINSSCITIISLISSHIITNFSNSEQLNKEFKVEFYLVRDIMYSISRCFGFIILLLVCIIFGKQYINYIMFLPAFSLLLEALLIRKINAK